MPIAAPAQIDAALLHVLSKILGRSPDELRADRGRYAAYQQDDSTFEEPWMDWKTLTVVDGEDGEDSDEDEDDEDSDEDEDDEDSDGDDGEGGAFIYGRRDFDVARSLFSDDFGPRVRGDRSLRRFLESTGGELDGLQLRAALEAGRIDESVLDGLFVSGRILARGESLLDASRALFMLEGDAKPLRPERSSRVVKAWKAHLAKVEPPALREHLSSFFLNAESARCDGAFFEEGGRDDEGENDVVAEWSLGEGQGKIELRRLDGDETAVPLPAFEGRVVLRKKPEPTVAHRPSAELVAALGSLPSTKADLWHEDDEDGGITSLEELVQAIVRDGAAAVMRPMREAELATRTQTLVAAIQALLEKKLPELAYALTAVALPFVTDGLRALFLYNQSVALHQMRRWEEAAVVCRAAMEASAKSVAGATVPPSFLHNNLAWSLYNAGDAPAAEPHAREATTNDPNNAAALATMGNVLFALGRHDEALGWFRRAVQAGTDPKLTPDMLRASPALRELVAELGVPVVLDDELVTLLGPEGWIDAEDDDDGEVESDDDDEDDEDD